MHGFTLTVQLVERTEVAQKAFLLRILPTQLHDMAGPFNGLQGFRGKIQSGEILEESLKAVGDLLSPPHHVCPTQYLSLRGSPPSLTVFCGDHPGRVKTRQRQVARSCTNPNSAALTMLASKFCRNTPQRVTTCREHWLLIGSRQSSTELQGKSQAG